MLYAQIYQILFILHLTHPLKLLQYCSSNLMAKLGFIAASHTSDWSIAALTRLTKLSAFLPVSKVLCWHSLAFPRSTHSIGTLFTFWVSIARVCWVPVSDAQGISKQAGINIPQIWGKVNIILHLLSRTETWWILLQFSFYSQFF